MERVRIAIVGCGQVTEDLHLPALLASHRLEMALLVDSHLPRAARLAKKFGLSCPTGTVLDERSIDSVEGVIIATPNNTHAALARAVLERRRPVFIEKPITVNYRDALDLCDLARRVGSFISVGFVTRHFPIVPLFKKLLDDGFFGRLHDFHFEYGTKGGWAPASAYTLSRSQSGGGVLVTNGTHFLDRMLYWFGYPSSFRYADDSYDGIEANAKASLAFNGGVAGTLFLSKTMSLKNRFEASTDLGLVEIPYAEPNEITIRTHARPDVIMSVRSRERVAASDVFRLQLEEFGHVIRHGGCPTVSGEIAAESVRLCEAFYSQREQLPEPWLWYRQGSRS